MSEKLGKHGSINIILIEIMYQNILCGRSKMKLKEKTAAKRRVQTENVPLNVLGWMVRGLVTHC